MEITLYNMPPRLAHKPQIERQIVYRRNLHTQQLAGGKQMPEISLRILRIDKTVRLRVDRRKIITSGGSLYLLYRSG